VLFDECFSKYLKIPQGDLGEHEKAAAPEEAAAFGRTA
jgi:hypothetical protein